MTPLMNGGSEDTHAGCRYYNPLQREEHDLHLTSRRSDSACLVHYAAAPVSSHGVQVLVSSVIIHGLSFGDRLVPTPLERFNVI